jgi:hypothetical protein
VAGSRIGASSAGTIAAIGPRSWESGIVSAVPRQLASEAGEQGGFEIVAWFMLFEQFPSVAILESQRIAMPKINGRH